MGYFNILAYKKVRQDFIKDKFVKQLLKKIKSEWCENTTKYSLLLNKTLPDGTASVTINDIHMCLHICSRELLYDKEEQEDYYSLDAGGYSEGTSSLYAASDIDILTIHRQLLVYDTIQDNTDHILMVMDETTLTGHVKLQLVQNGDVVACEDDNKYKSFCRIEVDKYDRPLLSNEFHNAVHDSAFIYRTKYSSYFTRHGPAVTISEVPSRKGDKDVDIVDAFFCPTPPFDISNLKYFSKQHNLQTLNSLGCFVVPITSDLNEKEKFQWRISFNLQERNIIRNFNDTQRKCLVLLKVIRYHMLKPELPDFVRSYRCNLGILYTKPELPVIVKSYHCKMAIFYVIAEQPEEIWIPENLIHCTLLCLERLRKWISNENIPNFFIPTENTLRDQMHFGCKKNLLSVLNDLIMGKLQNLLEKAGGLCIDFLLTNYFNDDNANNNLSIKSVDILNMLQDQMQEKSLLEKIYFEHESINFIDYCYKVRNFILVKMCSLRAHQICKKLHKIQLGFTNLRNTNYEHTNKFMFFQDLLMRCLDNGNNGTNLNVITEYSKTVIERVVELVQPLVHILLGTFYSTNLLDTRDLLVTLLMSKNPGMFCISILQEEIRDTQELWDRDNAVKAEYHFVKGMIGSDSNRWQVVLMKASMYLAFGKHVQCKELLKELAKDSVLTLKDHMTALTSVMYRVLWPLLPQYNLRNLEICYTPIWIRYTKCFEVATFPVAFTDNQSSMVPLPVVYEMYKMFGIVDSSDLDIDFITNQHPSVYRMIAEWLESMAHVDASFYMYYLQYRLFKQIKKDSRMIHSLHKMLDLMEGDILFAYRDTAWNLLGDIYRTNGWNNLALKCFRVSHQIQPKYNATKWHIMFLLFSNA